MKHLKTVLAGAILLIVAAMPSISAAQYREERLDNFLNSHPDAKSELMRNPNLIYDRGWRDQHPELREFMQNHPNVWGKLPGSGRWGAYGPDHSWHEADWWHQNNPDWIASNHPEWLEAHPDWRGGEGHVGDGDWDENHVWRDRDWWNAHHPDWVNKHHPEWYKHPEEHPVAAMEHREQVERHEQVEQHHQQVEQHHQQEHH